MVLFIDTLTKTGIIRNVNSQTKLLCSYNSLFEELDSTGSWSYNSGNCELSLKIGLTNEESIAWIGDPDGWKPNQDYVHKSFEIIAQLAVTRTYGTYNDEYSTTAIVFRALLAGNWYVLYFNPYYILCVVL